MVATIISAIKFRGCQENSTAALNQKAMIYCVTFMKSLRRRGD